MRLSMKDVAKTAGVSVATVSNVLSGKKYVSPHLKKVVIQTIEELGYKPSKIAQNLKQNRTYFIGLMIPDITNPYFAEIARGIEKVCLENDFQFFLTNTDGEIKQERKILDTFVSQHVEGIINVAPRMSENELKDNLEDTPTVILDRKVNLIEPLLDCIYMCNEKGAKQVAEHFLDKGYKKFACIAGPQVVSPARKRLKGFTERLKESGIPNGSIKAYFGDFKYASGYKLSKKLIDENELPLALFACNDLMAWGALEAIKEKELKIPEDIAIIGYDNIFISRLVVPALTTVDQYKYEAGVQAMNALLKKIHEINEEKAPIHNVIELKTQLIIRQSA
ncbi:MAG: LacI family DNA-binding transcriptional regulator [Thermotogota bacterium]